jgi:hypothetical protein
VTAGPIRPWLREDRSAAGVSDRTLRGPRGQVIYGDLEPQIKLATPQCLTGRGGTSLPAEGRLEHDHSVLDGITTAEAQRGTWPFSSRLRRPG